jgi:hypothetical protein
MTQRGLAMRQKYVILKDMQKNQFVIREYAELDKEVMSLLCEEVYDRARIESAIALGKDAVIAALRTKNLYPPVSYADRIAETVMQMEQPDQSDTMELLFDDIELLSREHEAGVLVADELEDESPELEDLLEDDFEDDFEDKDAMKNLKVADDEYGDLDEEA